MNIAVLISGGVDSAVGTHLLCEQGYKPDLFYIKIGMEGEDMSCTAEEDIELSKATARRYGLKLEVVDLQRQYWDMVVQYAVERVRKGLTPNPDVMCNKFIKFGCFEQQVGKYYDYTATGHYATRHEIDGLVWLGTARDPVKDQTDFLAQIDNLQISKLLFPVGSLMKSDVRRIAEANRLPSAKRKDSYGICFLGKINYNEFIRKFLGERKGNIIDVENGRVIGQHNGYWFHTIGQRKGLGLAGGPWFVVGKDIERNVLFVANGKDPEQQYGHEFLMRDFHFITADPWGEQADVPVSFKIRHTDSFMKGVLTRNGIGYTVRSEQRIQGIAPGQFGVIYDAKAELCLGSGEISTGRGCAIACPSGR
jgi:tRNA (5-methylaminomethyl-2-thiouridylate)-methyltransferase